MDVLNVFVDNKHYKRLIYILRMFREAGVVIEPNDIGSFMITGNCCHMQFMYGTNNFELKIWLDGHGAIDYGCCECCGYNFGGIKDGLKEIVEYLNYWGGDDND